LLSVGIAHVALPSFAQEAFPDGKPAVAPLNDSFYKAPAASALANASNGTVLRYRVIPASTYGARVTKAYQLMFRSTDGKGQPVASVTTLLIPKAAPASNRQLLSYQAFYDSLTLNCTPSYLTMNGRLFERGYMNPALDKGMLVVLPDYEGLQSQWIAGLNTAHGVLDGIRAAINFKDAGLNANAPIGLMGFSGGGHATTWAVEVAPDYAPELNIKGSAMGGIPVDPIAVARKVDGGAFSGVYLGAVVGLSRAYAEIDTTQYATSAGLSAIQDIGARCLLGMFEGQPEMSVKYAFTKATKFLKDPNFLDLPEMQRINAENTLGKRTPRNPVYIYEGTGDEIMPIEPVDNLVKSYCAAGVKVQYHRITGGDHLGMGTSPDAALSYVMDAMAGKALPSNCK
jgi:acetyl esterase/lipase